MQVGYVAKDCEALSSPTTLIDVVEQHSHTCMITVISLCCTQISEDTEIDPLTTVTD